MFTGIIQHVGRAVRVAMTPAGKRLRLDVGPLGEGLAVGASMAVDGACLTVAVVERTQAEFDAVPETLACSTLGALSPGAKVNLEPALPAGAPLDGHIVQGHVDGLAEVARIERGPAGWVLHLRAEEALTAQMVPKGALALAGVSLTVVEVGRGAFSVALIPTTLRQTTLGDLRPADRLNVELDVLGKYVRQYLQALLGDGEGLTMEKLRRAGFV